MKILFIPQLSMISKRNDKWKVDKDGNLLIASLFSRLFLEENSSSKVYFLLPSRKKIDGNLELLKERQIPIFSDSEIGESAAMYRFNIDMLLLKQLKEKINPDLIITSIPEQVPALRIIFSEVKIISILTYVTFANPTVLIDYFFEQYSGVRKSDLIFAYDKKTAKLFASGIEYYSLPLIPIYSLNIAFSAVDLTNIDVEIRREGSKVLQLKKERGRKLLFVPMRLSDPIRTHADKLIRDLKTLQLNYDFDVIFANPDEEVVDFSFPSISFPIRSRKDYIDCLVNSDAVVTYTDLKHHFNVTYYEASFLNRNVITSLHELIKFLEAGKKFPRDNANLYSYEYNKQRLVSILKKEGII